MQTIPDIFVDFQVCLPRTAEKLIAICEKNGIEYPKETRFVYLANKSIFGNIVLREIAKINNLSTVEIEYTRVFNFKELLQIADKAKFWEDEMQFSNFDNKTDLYYYGFISGEASLPFWYAEALALFLVSNMQKWVDIQKQKNGNIHL